MTTPTIHLTRDVFGLEATLGVLRWQGLDFGFAVEDEDRGLEADMTPAEVAAIKIKHETAIPAGLYTVRTTWSPKYMRQMPQVLGVPGFQGIRIHPGNRESETSGCILPGLTRDVDALTVGKSKLACDWLDEQIAALEAGGYEVSILIDRDPAAWATRGLL